MTTQQPAWRRDRPGLGVWEHRGKVAIAGWGHSPVDRRWDGVSLDKTLGAYCIRAAQAALEDAGVDPKDVDGLIVCPESMAGGNVAGASGIWHSPDNPRPYFAPPYDSEEGLSIVTAQWMLKNMPELTNVTYAPDSVPHIGEQMGMAAWAVANGLCHTALVVYGGANFEGRYRQGGDYQLDYARDDRGWLSQWTSPWGAGDLQHDGAITIQQYCAKYGATWEELLFPLIHNEHVNGRLNWWGYYTHHEPQIITREDYATARPTIWPLRIWDCDRPVNFGSAYVFTTAERVRGLKQRPVYVLNYNTGHYGGPWSSQTVLEDAERWASTAAQLAYEGSGLRPQDLDILNPYDGYSFFLPFTLEGFQFHGVKRGEAKEFAQEDISIKGPHPFTSGGGNLGNGRTRSAMYIDSIEQLRGTAGARQVAVKAETAICAFAPLGSLTYLCLSGTAP